MTYRFPERAALSCDPGINARSFTVETQNATGQVLDKHGFRAALAALAFAQFQGKFLLR